MANGRLSIAKTAGALLLAAGTFASIHGQATQPAPPEAAPATAKLPATAPMAFAVVSVKPAPPGTFQLAPTFMRDKTARILGVQKIVAPVNMLVGYAYGMQMSEDLAAFRKQPDWTRNKLYTVSFRADGEPTRSQVKEMMRTMLAERFGLQIHEFTREGMVNKLVLSKPGVLGPNLKVHPVGASCSTQEDSSVGHAPDTAKQPVAHCGLVWYYLPGTVLHEEMRDMTMTGLGLSLASRGDSGFGTYPVVDATGLTGTYDLTLEFLPGSINQRLDPQADDGDIPSLTRALKDQLGLRVESGEGPVRMVVIDHLSQPTAD